MLEKHIKVSFPESLEATLGHLGVTFVGADSCTQKMSPHAMFIRELLFLVDGR